MLTVTCDTCGWAGGPYKTTGYAEHALRRHSCTKQRRADAARLRRVRTRSKIDRTPQPCHHKRTTHQHGTHACYVLDKCRCRPCARANSDYERNRAKRNAYGRSNLVPAQPARDHITALQAQGMGLKRITAVSGISGGMLTKLLYGHPRPDGTRRPPAARVTKATAEVILTVTLDLADGVLTDHTGTARRLQALVHQGWSINRLAARSGIDRQRLDGALAGRQVRVDTARAVTRLYDTTWDQAPPQANQRERIAHSRALKYARDRGWVGPLAWDDDTIDNPAARPDLGEPDLRRGGRTFHIDDIEWLLTQVDYTWDGLATRLGIGRWAIERQLHRAGRRDLVARLTTNTKGTAA